MPGLTLANFTTVQGERLVLTKDPVTGAANGVADSTAAHRSREVKWAAAEGARSDQTKEARQNDKAREAFYQTIREELGDEPTQGAFRSLPATTDTRGKPLSDREVTQFTEMAKNSREAHFSALNEKAISEFIASDNGQRIFLMTSYRFSRHAHLFSEEEISNGHVIRLFEAEMRSHPRFKTEVINGYSYEFNFDDVAQATLFRVADQRQIAANLMTLDAFLNARSDLNGAGDGRDAAGQAPTEFERKFMQAYDYLNAGAGTKDYISTRLEKSDASNPKLLQRFREAVTGKQHFAHEPLESAELMQLAFDVVIQFDKDLKGTIRGG